MTRRRSFRSKVLVPHRSPHHVRRQRLLNPLLNGEPRPVAVIVAPAGYGKTTLLTDIAHEATGTVAWLSLDEWDRDPVTFMMYLRLALTGRSNGTPQAQTTPDSLHDALAGIVSAIEEDPEQRLLVLDDFHTVEESEPIVDLVNYLLQRLPANLRLLLSSRKEPGLRALPKLRLQGKVLDLTPEDVAFNEGEVLDYYDRRGIEISGEVAQRILEVTHGWPAGVALIDDPAKLPDDPVQAPAGMSDYLSAEVLAGLDTQLHAFLLETSVLDSLDPDACDSLLGRPANDELSRLLRSSVPLVRIEGAATEIRIHPLVRNALRTELKLQDPDRYRSLHRRAAIRCEEIGHVSDAISHRIQAEDWPEAASLVSNEAPRFYNLGRWHTIAAWIRSIPQAQLDEQPELRLWEARILARLGQLDSALRVLSEYSPLVTDPILSARFDTVRAAALRVRGDVAEAIAAARRAVDLAIRHDAPISEVAEARKEHALALVAEGSFEEAIEEFRSVLEFYASSGKTADIAFVNNCLGMALGAIGRLSESAEHLERARQQWQASGNAKELTYALNNLGVTYDRMGQAALASDILTQALEKARQSGNRRAEAYALASLGDLELQSDDAESARDRYAQALEISAELGDMTALTHARCGLARCYAELGRAGEGVTMARQALISAEERGSSYERGVALCALGRLERRRGRLDESISHFSAATTMFEKTNATRELGQALLLLGAAALPQRSSRTVARICLERFAKLAPDIGEGIANLAPPEDIRPLLEYGASRRIGGGMFRRMLREIGTTGVAQPPAGPEASRGRLPSVRVTALGDFRVSVNGRTVLGVEWESEKSKEMFLLLTMTGRPLSRDEIISFLWPETGGRKANSSFHSTLHRVRRAVYAEFIGESGGEYSVSPNASLESDVEAFRQAVDAAERGAEGEERLALLQKAVETFTGRFAPGFESEWIEMLRSSLEEQFLRAAGRLSEIWFAAGDYASTASVCERILEIEAYNESAGILLMKSLAAAGDVEGSLRTYRRLVDALEVELGVGPGETLQRLYGEIRNLVGRAADRAP